MQEASLPSPNIGAKGYHLRRISANAISHLEVTALGYANGQSPAAAAVAAFFTACAAAATEAGKPNPVLTLTPQTSTGAAGSTQQLTLGKGGSTGAATYTSSKPSVATVNSAGLVTRVATGTAVITASVAGDATYKPKSITAQVTVS
jgi:uncharacterized protein YjdB